MLTAKEFEARIRAFDLRLDVMLAAAERDNRDVAKTIAELERELDSIIEKFYTTFEDPSPPDEPFGNAPVGVRRRPTPPTRTGAGAEPFPPQNDLAET
ncbi:MAG: hypothetical protein V4671_02900 [Armatimonadota bacterium]